MKQWVIRVICLVGLNLLVGCANQTHIDKAYLEPHAAHNAKNADPTARQERASLAANRLNLSQAGMGVFSMTF